MGMFKTHRTGIDPMGKIKENQLRNIESMLHDLWELNKSKIPYVGIMCPLCLKRIELTFKSDKFTNNPVKGSVQIVREWEQTFPKEKENAL